MNLIIVTILLLFAISVALMLTFNYLASAYQQRKIRRHFIRIEEKPKKKPPPSRRGDDFLSRDKVAEKKKAEDLQVNFARYNQNEISQDTNVSIYNVEENHNLARQSEETTIVGLAKPVGRWSQFVMKQKLGFLIAMSGIQNKEQKGYWVNLIKAQDQSKGKNQQHGR